MSVQTFALKQGDTAPALTVTVAFSDGTSVDLTGATATFAMRDSTGTVKIPETAATVDATAGTVSYAWQSGQTDTAGIYHGEFTLNLLGRGLETHPSQFYIEVRIEPCFGSRPVPPMPLIFDGSWILDGSQTLDGVKN